jgi:hypothetical protein
VSSTITHVRAYASASTVTTMAAQRPIVFMVITVNIGESHAGRIKVELSSDSPTAHFRGFSISIGTSTMINYTIHACYLHNGAYTTTVPVLPRVSSS